MFARCVEFAFVIILLLWGRVGILSVREDVNDGHLWMYTVLKGERGGGGVLLFKTWED